MNNRRNLAYVLAVLNLVLIANVVRVAANLL